ncbi:MAG TPA: class I SAM-dependent methyltransferase [Thermoanaerobaculia bacterium]|nr:class I SAM-dependent methyltransferase [Thermoanaerobaculia bacterium]
MGFKVTKAPDAYGGFAWVYDRALGGRFYETMSGILDDVLERHAVEPSSHLDLACGTGLALHYFAERGHDSIGVDASLPMLRMARHRSHRLIAGDLRGLPLRGTFSAITCLYDSLNHLLEPGELLDVFRSVRSLMSDRSLFLFDVNHPSAYPRIWGLPEPFIASGSDYELTMETSWSRLTRRARARLSGWADFGGERLAIVEEHEQRAWSKREITGLLHKASLAPVEVIGFDPFDEQSAGDRLKMLFVVERAK